MSQLTIREKQLYDLYVETALDSKELAFRTHTTQRAVEQMMYEIRNKLGYTSSPQMLLAYWKERYNNIIRWADEKTQVGQ